MLQYEEAFQTIERPFAWLDLKHFLHNLHTLQQKARTKKVRVATKSIRSVQLLKLIEQRLTNLSGWMTYCAKETVYLYECGLNHFLLGYPMMEKSDVELLVKQIIKGADITFMVDDLHHLKLLQLIAQKHNIFIDICIDLNVSLPTSAIYFGTRRSSIRTVNEMKEFVQTALTMQELRITAIMGYEAQIAGVGNAPTNRAKKAIIQNLQQRSKKQIAKLRTNSVKAVISQVGPLRFVNGGGTGSIDFTSTQREVTEVTIGSGLFKPALFDQYDETDLKPAAGFALRVTRKPFEDTVVCHSGGFTASGEIHVNKQPVIINEGLQFYKLEGAGEVQTPLKINEGHYDIGDTIFFRHAKAGELCERFNHLHVIEDGHYKEKITTYRGDGKCFL